MSGPYVIGVDPGRTSGIARLDLTTWHVDLVQATPSVVLPIVRALAADVGAVAVLAVERFVVGPRAARSTAASAGRVTRDVIAALTAEGARLAGRVVLRSAGQVKPWATDARLAAAGLITATKGMPHARDAARHAVYAAVRDCGQPDPLSPSFPVRPVVRRW
jgi:hypothetical protein